MTIGGVDAVKMVEVLVLAAVLVNVGIERTRTRIRDSAGGKWVEIFRHSWCSVQVWAGRLDFGLASQALKLVFCRNYYQYGSKL
jgi:hypothetical protein